MVASWAGRSGPMASEWCLASGFAPLGVVRSVLLVPASQLVMGIGRDVRTGGNRTGALAAWYGAPVGVSTVLSGRANAHAPRACALREAPCTGRARVGSDDPPSAAVPPQSTLPQGRPVRGSTIAPMAHGLRYSWVKAGRGWAASAQRVPPTHPHATQLEAARSAFPDSRTLPLPAPHGGRFRFSGVPGRQARTCSRSRC
jgi:hypothetical protein